MPGIADAKKGKLLYHLTKLANLDSILDYGLLPRKTILESELEFNDVADENIIFERTNRGLDSYIPFHFHPYSAFDVAVKSKYGGKNMIYICIDRETARNNSFKILPRHPLSGGECRLYDYDEGFCMIDWDTLTEPGRNDSYAKEVKMAECLTDLCVPADCFNCIFVPSEEVKTIVERKLRNHSIMSPPPFVNVLSTWFRN